MATGDVIEEVATNLEEAATATRKLNASGIGFFFGGIAVGAAVGFYFGYRWNKEKLRAEAFKKSEEEVEKIREVYRESAESMKEEKEKPIITEKPSLEDVVEEKGYAQPEEKGIHIPTERPLKAPVPVQEPPVLPHRDFTPSGIAKRHVEREKDKNDGWDFEEEIARRVPTEPYIIHQDEFTLKERDFSQTTYTYYAVDSVLTDENEEKIRNPDQFVGVDNLKHFGHGADDYHVLYIRNERLELDFEICLVAASYEETVQGLSHDGES